MGISDKVSMGDLGLSIIETGSSNHQVRPKQNPAFVQGVVTYPLDILCNYLPKPTRLKIDVDGIEQRMDTSAPYEWGHAKSPHPQELNGLSVGDHEIKFVAMDELGNQGETSFKLTVQADTGLGEPNVANNLFSVYPNPASSQFTVELKEANPADVYVYNLAGELIYLQKEVINQCTINTSMNFKPGAYFVRIHYKEKGFGVKKVIIL